MRRRLATSSRAAPLFSHADPDALIDSGSPRLNDEDASARLAGVLNDLRFGGGWKRTGPGRLAATVRAINAYCSQIQLADVAVLDVGASDGTTTVELIDSLKADGARRVTACIMDKYVWLYRFVRGPVVEYRDADGQPLLSRLGAVGVRLPRSESRWNVPANALAALYLRFTRFRAGMRHTHALSLVDPRLVARPDLRVIEHDCLVRRPDLVGAIDVARASNLFNPANFGAPQILVALGHLHAYLRPGGCLLISRNVDRDGGEVERGTLWRRAAGGFVQADEFGGGSEVSAVVALFRIA